MTPRRIVILLIAASLLVAACGDDDTGDAVSAPEQTDDADASADASPVSVDIVDFDYQPATITVAAGTEITFVNQDSTAHTATDRGGSFNTESVAGGAEATITVTEVGEFTYYCAFHPFMEATVIVQ